MSERTDHQEARIRRDPSLTTADSQFIAPEDVEAFHNRTEIGGEGLTVAVMDSGIGKHPIWEHFGVTITRPEIDGLPTDGVDQVGHGSGCAGSWLLQAPKINELVSVPIFGKTGRTGLSRIRTAYEWLIENSGRIDLCNLSWGSTSTNPIINHLHNEMEQAGVHGIVAAGNTDRQTGSPATAGRSFSVAGVTLDKRMTGFSSPTDDVAALAKNVALPSPPTSDMGRRIPQSDYSPLMRQIGGEWRKASGTSFATPITGGLASTYRTEQAKVSMESGKGRQAAFEKSFAQNAVDVPGTDEDGFGYVDYKAAAASDPPATYVDVDVWGVDLPPFRGSDYIRVDSDIFESGKYKADLNALKEAIQER